jgi:hypothetical protein
MCHCDRVCPSQESRVCTTTGQEYYSECELRKHMCHTQESVPYTLGECMTAGSGSGASGGTSVISQPGFYHGIQYCIKALCCAVFILYINSKKLFSLGQDYIWLDLLVLNLFSFNNIPASCQYLCKNNSPY